MLTTLCEKATGEYLGLTTVFVLIAFVVVMVATFALIARLDTGYAARKKAEFMRVCGQAGVELARCEFIYLYPKEVPCASRDL